DSAKVVENWPDNLLSTLLFCLRPDPRSRPSTVTDILTWLETPPPSPVPAAVAVRLEGPLASPVRAHRDGKLEPYQTDRPPVRIFLVGLEAKPNLEIVVRRGVGALPTTVEEGEPVAVGSVAPFFDDHQPLATPADAARVQYGVFVRRRQPSGSIASIVTPAQV